MSYRQYLFLLQSEAQMKYSFKQLVFLKRVTSTCGPTFSSRFSFSSFPLLALVKRNEAACLCLKNPCYCICAILKWEERGKNRSFLSGIPRAPRLTLMSVTKNGAQGAGEVAQRTLVLGSHPCAVRRHKYSQGKDKCFYVTVGWFTWPQTYWGFTNEIFYVVGRSCGMWRNLILWEVVAVSEESDSFTFRERQSTKIVIYWTWSAALSECRVT